MNLVHGINQPQVLDHNTQTQVVGVPTGVTSDAQNAVIPANVIRTEMYLQFVQSAHNPRRLWI